MIKINIIYNNSDWVKYLKNPKIFVENKIKKFNKKFNKYPKKKLFVTILLSGDKEIKKLNKKFRKKDKVTDVLSFPFHNKTEFNHKLKKDKEIYLGDIIVNLSKIKKGNANKDFKSEFNKTWIHGLVHLFGYDHKKNREFKKMQKIEDRFLSYLK